MQAVAIGADGVLGDVSAVLALLAAPPLDKGCDRLGIFMLCVVTRFAHGLYFRAAVQNIGRRHHTFIIHVVSRYAVTVSTRDALRNMAGDGITLGKIHVTYQA